MGVAEGAGRLGAVMRQGRAGRRAPQHVLGSPPRSHKRRRRSHGGGSCAPSPPRCAQQSRASRPARRRWPRTREPSLPRSSSPPHPPPPPPLPSPRCTPPPPHPAMPACSLACTRLPPPAPPPPHPPSLTAGDCPLPSDFAGVRTPPPRRRGLPRPLARSLVATSAQAPFSPPQALRTTPRPSALSGGGGGGNGSSTELRGRCTCGPARARRRASHARDGAHPIACCAADPHPTRTHPMRRAGGRRAACQLHH